MSVDAGPVLKKPKLITDFFGLKKTGSLKAKPQSQGPETKNSETKSSFSSDVSTTAPEIKTSSMPEHNEKAEADSASKVKASSEAADKAASNDYEQFCSRHNFDKSAWVASLTDEEKSLLALEINTIHVTWLAFLHKELTKPYFLNLKRFLKSQAGKSVFPPPGHIYSWSHFTPLPDVKCLILGQDPYHNVNQAHGLAFSVLEPTRPPPSLLNIYKTLKIDFPDFDIPDYKLLLKQGKPGGGNLTVWAKRGVLMLNACLTVEAHKANSHAGKGWEQFTEKVIETAIKYARDEENTGFVIMAWGLPAQKRVGAFDKLIKSSSSPFLVLRSVHPSPLLASRGFFESQVFKKCNDWLREQGLQPVDWSLVDGKQVVGTA